MVRLAVASRRGGPILAVSALVLPKVTVYDGEMTDERPDWTYLRGLELADPEFWATDSIDILLGADVHAFILQAGLMKGGPQDPIAQQTTLGWILSGATGPPAALPYATTHYCQVQDDLAELVRGFWHQEELPSPTATLTAEEKKCEEFFVQTHSRDPSGRYTVRLPVIAPLPTLDSTRLTAIRVLTGMERRFLRNERLHQLYVDFLQQYEALGHMTPAVPAESGGGRVSYLPHHGVMKEASTSTKLRVVFNGSTTTVAGDSLNRSLMVGPNLLPPLSEILLRWRFHRYVLATDVEKMYRQILVHPDDRDLQRIIWRGNPQDALTEYQLNTVTYGLSCAPFLAMRTMRQLAEDERLNYPRGATALRRDVYMDDILTGASTIAEALELQQQLINLCSAGGFPLRKWSANSPTLLANIPDDHRLQRDLRSWRPQDTHATLGLQWHPGRDGFSFATQAVTITAVTKRSVLSLTSRLFDPLGWLAPVVVSAKTAFQATWLQGVDWDTPLDESASRRWRDYQDALPALESILVPRWIGPENPDDKLEIHGFADASERAYAGVVYLRAKGRQSCRIHLVAAKTKVAPIKPVTLPRLELCAAALLTRLASWVCTTLGLDHAPLHLWSDSTVALGWIRGHPSRWRTYVANRVADIQTTAPAALWHHVPTQDNPADCASRGLSPRELADHRLWWHGPPWLLTEPSSWPSASSPRGDGELPEARTQSHVSTPRPQPEIEEPEELTRFSSLQRLLRVSAWCRRWLRLRSLGRVQTDSDPRPIDVLSTAELDDARMAWIRLGQADTFKAEIKALQQGQSLARSSTLTRFDPFLDPQGLLRVGGRLKHAVLSYDERHPVILPSRSHFTYLVVDACHRRTLHGGVQLTLAQLRQRYWIPRGRSVIKKLILRCVTCVRWRAASPQQLMSSLPKERVTVSRPFLHTGVDYAGPIMLRTTKGRGHRAYKGFIAVFVCLATRAVHLEVVSDYSADAFLAAFRRFTSRRGLCRTILSDCGTTFVGADAQLRKLFAASSPERRLIADPLATDGVEWRFNPPAAPHFGGIWEAAVKSVKHHLRRVIGDTTLTFEELTTFLTQVEACLNSRPLQALSDDPDDLAALTPGHFLIGSALTAVPEASLRDQTTSRLNRWQLLQQMRDHFWDRWSREYLHSLAHRPKWFRRDTTLEVGRLCLLRNENTPPTRWPLARIIRLHRGEDNQIRVVTVRTAASEFTRPVAKLVLMPDCRDSDVADPCT